MTIGERIKKRRLELGWSVDKLADVMNINRSTIFRYEKGDIEKVSIDILKELSIALKVSPLYLMGMTDDANYNIEVDNISTINTRQFPLLGEIACGTPIMAEENIELYVEAGTSINADFCLRCKGDSMINARINDGDIVFIRKQPMVDNGDIAAVIINDEATLKRVYYYPGQNKLVLQAENPKYAPFVYVGEELNQIRILGKAIAFQSDVR